MREPRSRLTPLALALVLGAAGAYSSGVTSSASPAPCLASSAGASTAGAERSAITAWQRVATGGGWKRTESERSGSGAGSARACRHEVAASPRRLTPLAPADAPAGPKHRGSVGLLGLGTSPANAPPRS